MQAEFLPQNMLRRAPARRAAVQASYLKANRGDCRVAFSAALVDDLCRMLAFADAIGASDAALACAAAEADPALSFAAGIVYGARLRLRAAGFTAPAPQQDGPVRMLRVAHLDAAFGAVRDSGYDVARVPRRLLSELGSPGSTLSGAHRRIWEAAISDDPQKLIDALCAPPYSIGIENLRSALAQAAGARDLTAAVTRLRGSQAREAALAAISALDAARPTCQPEEFTLAGALESLHRALAVSPDGDDLAKVDPEFEPLRRAAADADRIWCAETQPAEPAMRVSSLLQSLTCMQKGELALVPTGSLDSPCPAIVCFEDDRAAPVLWESFAAALGFAGNEAEEPRSESALNVSVSASLERAVVDYLFTAALPRETRAWPLPEPPATFVAPAMTFSASRLNAYVKCPRRWFYEYMCEALEDPASLNVAYGRVMHDALEALHREVRVPGEHDAASILERLLRDLDAAFGRARNDFSSQLEYEVSRCRARRMAEQYVLWLRAEAARAPFEIAGVELLQRQRFGDHEFVGYVDRIDRPLGGGPVTIFDYKTGHIDTDAQSYLEKVRRGDEAQLALYFAMRRAAGDEISRIALVSIRDPRDDVWILALDVVGDESPPVVEREAHDGVLRATCSRADLDASLAALVERCDLLTKLGLDHFAAGDDPPCSYCAYAGACRERPIDGERIFAR